MKEYKLDRNHFEALTIQEADEKWHDYRNTDWKERLEILLYLNSIGFRYAGEDPPVLDRTAFSARKLTDE